jgi:predicted alpha/beta superfamily hydrolase
MAYIINTYGNPDADILLIQTADDHDMEVIEKEISYIRELSGNRDFCLIAVKVDDWNKDLSPWPEPAVFGDEDFGEGAPETLKFLLENVLVPDDLETTPGRRIYLGGYSLAGLFALWAGCQTDAFDGIAAASPSVWFPGFAEYLRNNIPQTKAVYLSLGDREERTRHPLMSQVGNAIRSTYEILKESVMDCVLEWNKGNHFKNPDLRSAKAFAWLMNRDKD